MIDYEKIAEGVELPREGGEEVVIPLVEPVLETAEPEEVVIDPSSPEYKKAFYSLSDPRYQGLAAEKGYSQDYSRIQKLRYTHEAMIDMILANPTAKQKDLAEQFGVSGAWMSRVIGSDAFQGALAKRREELSDPFLTATIEERFRGLAMQSLDVIQEKLETAPTMESAFKALELSSKALGFGARTFNDKSTNIGQQFVIRLPEKITDPEAWARTHNGGGVIIDQSSGA